ncbi:MAG: flagellar motor switch protein FliN [Planctomycetaceae bacterium]|nr:flagellar motor switch protein FliN [Planctomycetaceae bacterium]
MSTSSADTLENNETAIDQIMSNAETAIPEAHPVEFPQVTRTRASSSMPLERFAEVAIEISVEIGRVTMSIGELLKLGEGAVVELNRAVSEPVDVMAQGVRIASGEVVVIDDRFAVRITEIVSHEDGSRPGAVKR